MLMTSGTPQVGKIGSFVCACFFVCDVFLVTHVGELLHLRPLHTQIFQVEKD